MTGYGQRRNTLTTLHGITAIGVPVLSDCGAPVASVTLARSGATMSESAALADAIRLRDEAAALQPLLSQLHF